MFVRMFKSAKFWTAVFDMVCSLSIYFVGKYAGAAAADLKFIIAAIQPVFLMVIAGWAWEDAFTK